MRQRDLGIANACMRNPGRQFREREPNALTSRRLILVPLVRSPEVATAEVHQHLTPNGKQAFYSLVGDLVPAHVL